MIKQLANCYKKLRSIWHLREFSSRAVVGKDLQVGPLSVCANRTGKRDSIQIGDNCYIAGRLMAQETGRLQIGSHVYIGQNTVIGARDSVVIGDCVIIAGDIRIMDNNNHPTSCEKRMEMSLSGDYFGPLWSWKEAAHKPVVIEENVWIGEYSAILKGVHIGKGAVIGCHSVVTKDVPPYAVVAGNPARVVKYLKSREEIEGKESVETK